MVMPESPIALRCPSCGADDPAPIKRFDDGVVVGRCRVCDLVYTPRQHPRPHTVLGPGDLVHFRKAYAPVLSGARPHYRRSNYREYLRIVAPLVERGRLLDVGCAHGFLAREARSLGFDVTGVEPHSGMADFAEKENGIDVLRGRVEDVELPSEAFDVALFTDSLEYIADPLEALRRVHDALRPRGVLFVKVPNEQYFALRHALAKRGVDAGGGEAYGPSLRVVHYDPATLGAMVRDAGFEVLRVGWPGPVHSPPVRPGERWDETAPRPWERLPARIARQVLHAAGRMEAFVTRGDNHLSVSLYALARRPDGPT